MKRGALVVVFRLFSLEWVFIYLLLLLILLLPLLFLSLLLPRCLFVLSSCPPAVCLHVLVLPAAVRPS
jgi:hypothetical protein